MSIDKNSKTEGKGLLDLGIVAFSWSSHAQEYAMMVELMPKVSGLSELMDLLHEVNIHLMGEKYIFDGTVSSLRFLSERGKLNPDDLKNDLLRSTVLKYLNGDQSEVEVSCNRWSRQALSCKIVAVGLFIRAGKISVTKKSVALLDCLEKLSPSDLPLFDDDFEKGNVSEESNLRLLVVNNLWMTITSNAPWFKNNGVPLFEIIMNMVTTSFFPDTLLYFVFEKLQPLIDPVVEKYFPDFNNGDHTARVAVRHASVIVMLMIIDVGEATEDRRHKSLRVDGILHKWIEYIFDDEMEVQVWVRSYLQKEMDPRVKFLRTMVDLKIFVDFPEGSAEMLEKMTGHRPTSCPKVAYLPIFESFRLFPPGFSPILARIVEIFDDDKLDIQDKEEVVKLLVFNIQRLVVASKKSTAKDVAYYDEEYLKDAYILLVLSILQSSMRSVPKKLKNMGMYYSGELNDMYSVITIEAISAILKFDSSKGVPFFAYIKKVLPLYVKSELRSMKIDEVTDLLDDMQMNDRSKDLCDNDGIGSVSKKIDSDLIIKRIHECIKDLPDKEYKAIEKAHFACLPLNATERRAKNRGLEKLRSKYPELKSLLHNNF